MEPYPTRVKASYVIRVMKSGSSMESYLIGYFGGVLGDSNLWELEIDNSMHCDDIFFNTDYPQDKDGFFAPSARCNKQMQRMQTAAPLIKVHYFYTRRVKVMKLKCNTCSRPITISGPVKIYSGEFCSAGCWDERGNENSEAELNSMKFDPWEDCSHFESIGGA